MGVYPLVRLVEPLGPEGHVAALGITAPLVRGLVHAPVGAQVVDGAELASAVRLLALWGR